jgi:ssDNA-binding replication factor A large subunit
VAAQTLAQKLETVRVADEAGKAALADLLNPDTGEALAPGDSVFDVASKHVYTNDNGKLVRTKPRIIQQPKAPS